MEIDDHIGTPITTKAPLPLNRFENSETPTENVRLLERGPSRELFRINSILLRNKAANAEHSDEELANITPKKILKRFREQKPRD